MVLGVALSMYKAIRESFDLIEQNEENHSSKIRLLAVRLRIMKSVSDDMRGEILQPEIRTILG